MLKPLLNRANRFDAKRFAKYQWIDVDVIRAAQDPRPESYKLNVDTIKIGESLPSADGWRARKQIVRPLIRQSMCGIRQERDAHNRPTLGLFKPAKIKRLIIEPEDNPDWTAQQLANLDQTMLFQAGPSQKLEKLPYKFKYQFDCADPNCGGHTMSCTDWEMGESFRRWRSEYRDQWEAKFRQKYEDEMINKLDTHFYVGTVHRHPREWIVVGLFYPPREAIGDLFDL